MNGNYHHDATENAFLDLLDQTDDWELGDDGTLATVLRCVSCGHEETFSDRESALAFLADGDVCDCVEPHVFTEGVN